MEQEQLIMSHEHMHTNGRQVGGAAAQVDRKTLWQTLIAKPLLTANSNSSEADRSDRSVQL